MFSYSDCYWADNVASNCGNKALIFIFVAQVPKCLSNAILTNLNPAFKSLKEVIADRLLWFCICGYNDLTQRRIQFAHGNWQYDHQPLSNSNCQLLLKVSSGERTGISLQDLHLKLQKAGASQMESLVSLGNLGDNCNSNCKLRWFIPIFKFFFHIHGLFP